MKALPSLVVASLLGISAVATAGSKQSQPVIINAADRIASGSMATARRTLDTVQFLGCQVGSSPGVGFGSCTARDANGQLATCFFFNDALKVDALAAMSSDSYIWFSWTEQSECLSIVVETSSYWEPKK